MLFNSLSFLIFFPLVTAGYFALPHHHRWWFLLVASCYFYMALIPIYILILGITIIVDYYAGIWIEQSQGRRRTLFLWASLVTNVGILFIFKYFNFFNSNIRQLAEAIGWNYPLPALEIILPVGLSFHTFQAMSYTIEVYRGRQTAEHHFGIYALYVMFYPQLVAGPIERPQNILHQFYEKHSWDIDRAISGVELMTLGFFKKIVIADRLAPLVNQIYSKPLEYRGLPLILASYAFAVQIYCDFSGYSDIARGTARVMGFKLMANFDRPYSSTSIPEFWRRWHISLSSWFKDYLYISIGGRTKRIRNSFIVFLVSGLWHGANWPFVIWGAYHGSLMAISFKTQKIRERIRRRLPFPNLGYWQLMQTILTFNLVCIGWIFFRANSIPDAAYIASNLTHELASQLRHPADYLSEHNLTLSSGEFMLALFAVGTLIAIEYPLIGLRLQESRHSWPRWIRACMLYAMIVLILVTGRFAAEQFIYFQF